jgi:hypothetical protein
MPTPPITDGFSPSVTTNRGSGSFSQHGGSTNQFWRPSRVLARQVMQMAGRQFSQPIQQYPGSTATPTSPYITQGAQQLAQRAAMGSPITGEAEQLGASTLRGDYLDPSSNPWLERTFQAGARGVTSEYQNAVLPALETRFARGGSGNSNYGAALGRSQDALGTSLGDLATQIYGGAYEAERGRQNQALAMAPMLQQLGYADIDQLMRAGGVQQAEGQRLLDADVQKWRFQQMEPWQRAGLAAGLYGQSPVVSGTQFWQEGTQSESGKQVTVAPEQVAAQPDPMQYWMGLLSSFI